MVVKSGNVEMLTYFIMRGARIDEIKKENMTAEEKLINEAIREAKERAEILGCYIDTLEEKISNLDDINKKDMFGNTLLNYAIERNDRDMVNMLIDKGAKVNIRNKNNETPLYQAIKYAGSDIVVDLMKNDANIKDEVRG